MNMTLNAIRYHRNGVAGQGFWAIAFSFKEGRQKTQHLHAAVFCEPEYDGQPHPCTGRLAVLEANDVVSSRWRGDVFEPQLRQWISEADASL